MNSYKPEYMTRLLGDQMVSKTHGRIAFRGSIDSLEAEFIEAQVLASQLGEEEYCAFLGEILDYLKKLMVAEVRNKPLDPPFIFGMDADEIHKGSHFSVERAIPFPSYKHGPLASRINKLRTKVRETELLAVRIFHPGETEEPANITPDTERRDDIILALNRLSSALWWLFVRYTDSQQKA